MTPIDKRPGHESQNGRRHEVITEARRDRQFPRLAEPVPGLTATLTRSVKPEFLRLFHRDPDQQCWAKGIAPGWLNVPRARGPTSLDPYLGYIEERIARGCRFPELIWQELKRRSYTGSCATVRNCAIRLLFPQGKEPLVQACARCHAHRPGAGSDGLSDGGGSRSRSPGALMSASCRRCAKLNPWSARSAGSRVSFSVSCTDEVRVSSIDC